MFILKPFGMRNDMTNNLLWRSNKPNVITRRNLSTVSLNQRYDQKVKQEKKSSEPSRKGKRSNGLKLQIEHASKNV